MKKQDIIDALRAFNVQDDEMQGQTMSQLSQRLSELNKKQAEEEGPKKPAGLKVTEITRSYARKKSMPENRFENEDYFCSRTAEITEDDDIKAVSNWIAYECKCEVEEQMANRTAKKKEDKIPF